MLEIRNLEQKDIKVLEDNFKEIFINNKISDHIKLNPFTTYIVIYNDNNIIGFINYDKIYDRLELININIIDSEKGKGYGNLLMNYMIDNNKDISNITLEVRKDNYIAINMYEKYGFKQVAIRKNYYNGVDGILMEKVIRR